MLTHILSQIDGVEVLTQTSLQQLIDALQTEEDKLKDSIYEWTTQLLNKSADEEELQNLVEAIDSLKQGSFGDEVQSLIDQLTDYKKRSLRIREIDQSLKQKEFQVILEEQYKAFEEHCSMNEYSEAAWCLLGIDRMIQDHKTEDINNHSLDLQSFLQRLETGDQSLKQMISNLFENCIKIEDKKNEVLILAPKGDAVKKQREAWKAAEVLKTTDYILQSIANQLNKVLLDHVLNEDFAGTLLMTEIIDCTEFEIIRWNSMESTDILKCIESRFAISQQILKSIGKNVLFEMESLFLELGSKIWTDLYQVLTSKMLCCGDRLQENDQLHFLQGIHLAAEELERELKKLGFLSDEEVTFSSILATSSKSTLRKLSERSMYSILHQKEIQVPQLGMLLANDLFHLSQELLKVPILVTGFRELAPDVTFMEEAQQLHAAGKAVLARLVKSKRNELQKVLEEAGNLGALKTGQQGIAMRKTSNQLLRMLKKLGQNMSETLTNSDHCEIASQLATDISEPILHALMSRTDISAQESKELPKELNSFLEQLTPALLSIPAAEFAQMVSEAESYLMIEGTQDQFRTQRWMLHQQFDANCPRLRKLQRLLKLWDSSLKTIVEWWRSGILEEEGFDPEEIRNIIWALFEHSDKRDEAIFAVTFSSSQDLQGVDSLVQDFYTNLVPYPIHLAIDANLENLNGVKLTAQVSRALHLNNVHVATEFVDVECKVEMEHAESLGLSLLQHGLTEKMPQAPDNLMKTLKKLIKLVDDAYNYVSNVVDENSKGDSTIGRYLADTLSVVPFLEKDKFESLFQDRLQELFLDFPTNAMTFEAWISTSDYCHPGAIMSYAIKSRDQDIGEITKASNHFVIFDVKNILACHDFEFIDIIPDLLRASCHGYYNKTETDINPRTGKLVDRQGTWRHLAVTWSQEKKGETIIYIDGVVVGTAVTGKDTPIQDNGVFMLGGEQDCYGGCTDPKQGFYGLMDEVRIWKAVRTQEEIVRHMRSTGEELQNHEDLVAYWKFDDPGSQQYEGFGVLADSSGRGNDLDILVPPKRSQVYIEKDGNSLRTHALTFKNNYAMNSEITGFPQEDITVEFWARSGALTGSPMTNERYSEFFSFASLKESDDATGSTRGHAGTALIDDAIRIERYLTEYNETQYLKNSKTNTLGSISVHVNSNRQGNGRGNDNWIDFATEWTDEEWHHIAVTWDFKSGRIYLIFDGEEVTPFWKAEFGSITDKDPANGGVSNTLAARIRRSEKGSLVLGQNQECYGGCFSPSSAFDGSLANVRIWDRVLSTNEIKQNMFENEPNSKSGLVMNFKFDKERFLGDTERTRYFMDKTGQFMLSLGSIGPGFQYSTAPLTKSNGDPVDGPKPGYTGYALELNDQQLLMLRDFKDFPSKAITVEFWMWSIDSCRQGVPFSYANGGYQNNDNAFLIFNYNDWGIAVNEDEGDLSDHNAGFASTDGKWHHIAVTWESKTGKARFYDNGRLQWEVERAKGKAIESGGTLVIGREQDCLGGCFDSAPGAAGDIQQVSNLEYGPQDFYGIIEDVRIWSTVRAQDQIVAGMIYDKEVGSGKKNEFIKRNDKDLVAWWKFDEGKGYTVRDETGHGHTLRILSEPRWVVPKWVETCGNGVLEAAEECDDGNRYYGDGCSPDCKVETGYRCTYTNPSRCTLIDDNLPQSDPKSGNQQQTVYTNTAISEEVESSSSSSSSVSSSGGKKSKSGVGGFIVFLVVALILVGIFVAVYRNREAIYEQAPGLKTFAGNARDRINRAFGRDRSGYTLAAIDPEEMHVSAGFVDAQPPASTQAATANVPYEPIRD
eukprot:g4547.t1